MWISPAYAQAAPAAAPGAFDMVSFFLPLVLIFIIMYFLVIRPQQRRVKQHQDMVAALRKGDVVITGGGIVGKVKSVSDADDEVVVEVAKGVDLRVIRGSISDVRSKTEPLRDAKPAANDSKDAS